MLNKLPKLTRFLVAIEKGKDSAIELVQPNTLSANDAIIIGNREEEIEQNQRVQEGKLKFGLPGSQQTGHLGCGMGQKVDEQYTFAKRTHKGLEASFCQE